MGEVWSVGLDVLRAVGEVGFSWGGFEGRGSGELGVLCLSLIVVLCEVL